MHCNVCFYLFLLFRGRSSSITESTASTGNERGKNQKGLKKVMATRNKVLEGSCHFFIVSYATIYRVDNMPFIHSGV